MDKIDENDKPLPVPIYTQGDDIILISGEVGHILTTTEGSDTRTTDNVITGPAGELNHDQLVDWIARWHEEND